MTCLEFHATPEQNDCRTDSDAPAVSASNLLDIVEDGNPIPVGPDPIYVDNGTKTPVIQEIYDRFEGRSGYLGNPSGAELIPLGGPASAGVAYK